MKQKAILSQLTAYKQGKQSHEIQEAYGLDRIVKLASNENVYGYSEKVKDYLIKQLPELNIYPDGYTAELRTAVANYSQVDENQIIFGSGSEEIIQIICRAFVFEGRNTVMAANSFSQYKHNTLVEGGTVKEIPVTSEGSHDLEAMSEAIDENTSVVWICNPDNPTGTTITEKELLAFMENCPKDVLVVLDEAYKEFVEEDFLLDSHTYLAAYANLISLRTFSKAYGLAGLRIGYGIGNPEVIHSLNVVRGPFNTTSVAQLAALIALGDQAFIKETKEKNNREKQKFYAFLDEIGWHYYPSQTNFIFVSTPVSGIEVFQYLIENGFIIRPGELLGYPNSIRITIGTEDDMKELQCVLRKFNK